MGVSMGDIGSLTPHSGTRKDGIPLTPVAVRNQTRSVGAVQISLAGAIGDGAGRYGF
jgi:hypothetical protein